MSAESHSVKGSPLDGITLLFRPAALRWEAAKKRREEMRTDTNRRAHLTARTAFTEAAADHRAARADLDRLNAQESPDREALKEAQEAVRETKEREDAAQATLREAERHYPSSLPVAAAKAHTAHTVLTVGLATTDLTGQWPVALSVAAVAGHLAVLWAGRRGLEPGEPAPAPEPVMEPLTAALEPDTLPLEPAAPLPDTAVLEEDTLPWLPEPEPLAVLEPYAEPGPYPASPEPVSDGWWLSPPAPLTGEAR